MSKYQKSKMPKTRKSNLQSNQDLLHLFQLQETTTEHRLGKVAAAMISNGNIDYFESAAGDIYRRLFSHSGPIEKKYIQSKIDRLRSFSMAEHYQLQREIDSAIGYDYTAVLEGKSGFYNNPDGYRNFQQYVNTTWQKSWEKLKTATEKAIMDPDRRIIAMSALKIDHAFADWSTGKISPNLLENIIFQETLLIERTMQE